MERVFYRIRNDENWLNHNFIDLAKAEEELEGLKLGTHIVSKLVPRDDFYIVKVTETEERINDEKKLCS